MIESNKFDLEVLGKKGAIMGTVSYWQSYRRYGNVPNSLTVATKLGDRIRLNAWVL
jgi:hypothetical protein